MMCSGLVRRFLTATDGWSKVGVAVVCAVVALAVAGVVMVVNGVPQRFSAPSGMAGEAAQLAGNAARQSNLPLVVTFRLPGVTPTTMLRLTLPAGLEHRTAFPPVAGVLTLVFGDMTVLRF